MVGPSKILTVSYGTFSCTLEGFDEPFTTMKAIAEYFRDLAADDRYFGAEPPTPDAEMLQRIAEREIQRRVETKISEMGVVLRQAGPDATVTPLATAPAAPVAPAPAATAPIAPNLVAHAAPMAEAAPTVAKDLPAAAAPAPVAAVGVPKAADAAQEAQTHRPEVVTDEAYEAALDDIMDEAAAGDVTDVAVLDETAFAESSAAEPATGEDSIAAKLMRIRAVVEGAHRHAKSAFETDDETDASTMSAEPLAADFGFEIDMGKDMPELHAAEAERAALRATTGAEPAALDDIADMSDDLDFDDEPTLAAEPDDSVTLAAAFSDADESAEADDALMAQLSSLRAAVAEHHAAEHRASEAAAEPAPEAPYADLAEAGDAEEAMLEPSEPDFAPRPSLFERARARVLRMGKAATDKDAEAAVAEPEIEPVSDFAEVDADDAFVVADKTHDALALGAETDADLSRLMEEARTKLEGAENRRRFSAISHLKAAVAATLADRKFAAPDTPTQPEIEKAEELSLYREDLSKVVRPRRPAGDALHATPRPDVRPAPLVLVSEQRIDRPGAGAVDAAAIRPRRMAATNLAMFTDDAEDDAFDEADLSPESASSFADFAERIGATSLTELLEAAAAYTASVEGHSHFSRPQILRKVEFVSSRGGYNREDGLRSFGMLLRQGKIQKVSPGQFTLADGSKFTEEARRAAH